MEDSYCTISKGPAAAHIYLMINNICECQLTLDWSYDAIYYKYYDDDWIILSIGPKTTYNKSQIDKINTQDKVQIFKKLAEKCLTDLPNYSTISDRSLISLREIKNLL
jgi:hypothetical protein